ncbi:MAG: ABC transporter ATP-binding protein [Bacteroides sp.]
MLKEIYHLLSRAERRRGGWVALSVLVRAILDFAGVAALLPVLILVMGDKPEVQKSLLLCLAVLAFILIKNGLVVWLARLQSRFLLDLYKEFSRKMFCNYYNRGLLFLKSKSSVQLGHEVNFVCYTFSLCVLAPIFRVAGEALLLVLMVTALIVFAPSAGLLLCVGFLPLVVFYVWMVKGRLRRYGAEELDARRNQSRTVVEAFRGYSELEISQAFRASLASFDEGARIINHSRLRMEILQLFPSCLSEVSIVVGLALLIGLGGGDLRVISGVFAIAAYRMIPSVRGILNNWSTLQNASHSIRTVVEGVRAPEMIADGKESVLPFHHSITMDDLSFAFPDGGIIIQHFNGHIDKGERIGIRGTSGSGKSTLFNLLLGFFEPTSGEICIDGVRLTAANRKQWHKRVGYVPQEIFIIQGSLAENVALGRQEIDRSKVTRVLEQVQLKEWSEALSEGIDTSLGE